MGGGGGPKPDKNIGLAAMKSAELGEDYLAWTKERSKTTDLWASQDRARSKKVFEPLQDKYISDAKAWASPTRLAVAARDAKADALQSSRAMGGAMDREMLAKGVNPSSGRYVAGKRALNLSTALAAAGAANTARRGVKSEADARLVNAINMGSGAVVNPLSAFEAGSRGVASGANMAMSGYNQQGSLLNQQFQGQLQQYQAQQDSQGQLFGALGTAAGMAINPTAVMPWLAALSDEKAKRGKKSIPKGRSLAAVRDMRVEEWEYKPDAAGGDGGGTPHVGTYAQDFQKATGKGDGRTINLPDAIGVTMGAVKDLDRKVSRIARKLDMRAAA